MKEGFVNLFDFSWSTPNKTLWNTLNRFSAENSEDNFPIENCFPPVEVNESGTFSVPKSRLTSTELQRNCKQAPTVQRKCTGLLMSWNLNRQLKRATIISDGFKFSWKMMPDEIDWLRSTGPLDEAQSGDWTRPNRCSRDRIDEAHWTKLKLLDEAR